MPRPQEGYHHLDPEVIARNPPRFAELVHWTDTWGFEDNRGPVPWQDRESSNGGGGFVGGVAAVSVAAMSLPSPGLHSSQECSNNRTDDCWDLGCILLKI